MFFLKALSQSRYFLSAMTGMLLTGSVFAGTAGRVNFIAGEVTSTSMDNATHTLYKGDLINAGDKLETSKNGRLQIRFTDGSILSLKPNSIFSVEKYSFSRDTPEQGNAVFNFVRGGFRTISGAIGKVNRMNYKMNTPFATIGIRGTDYSASIKNEKVFVTVTEGKVHADNDAGNADINAGESYVIGDKTIPTLCHIDETVQSSEGFKKTDIPQPCSPVTVPLEAEDGFYISKLKVKKPVLESFKSYGDYAEAVRRYNTLIDEMNQIGAPTLIDEKKAATSSAYLTQVDINRTKALNTTRLLNGALDSTEMRDSSVINDFLQLTSPTNLLDAMDTKDLLNQSLPTKLSEEIAINMRKKGIDALSNIDIFGLLFSTFTNNTKSNFLGNKTSIFGADFGTSEIDVTYGNILLDGIFVELSPAKKNANELIGLGILQPDILSMDANNNSKLRGFSFKQGIMHDNDGIASNKNSGSLVIGNGSAQQATVIYTDELTPISVNLKLGDRTKTNSDTSDLLDINVSTPKLAIKIGDIYVSGSDSSAENIDKDGNANLGSAEVFGTSQDGVEAIKIMGASEIVLGAAKIGVKLMHHNDLRRRTVDGIDVIPSISILADAFIKNGVTIKHLNIKDAGGSIKGGSIMMNSLKLSDHNSSDLTAILAVNIEPPKQNDKSGGVLLTLKQLGDSIDGIDIGISDLRVGSEDAPDIGDVQMIGLRLNGANLLLRGH
ncbi:MAG: FecR family protein [Agitococcus sp.]|nr:FecR family protein [Agitococcus sp.]